MDSNKEPLEKSPPTKLKRENEEIVGEILDTVVGDIASHQLDGMAEEEEIKESVESITEDNAGGGAKPKSISKEASAESSTDSAALSSTNSYSSDNIYHVKWISWNSQKVPIVTQNSNGPCPMLAIANILLLRGKMALQDGCEVVSSEQLLENLGKISGNPCHFFKLNKDFDDSSDLFCFFQVIQCLNVCQKIWIQTVD